MAKRSLRDWILPRSRKRQVALLVLLLLVFVGERWYRYWTPAARVETSHYLILSTASKEQTREIGAVVEALYGAYQRAFPELFSAPAAHPRLQLKLYADRDEFRRSTRTTGWAEAFYRAPYCHAYYSSREANPYHWMAHEAVHQLNNEVAHLDLQQWVDEGLADYFGCTVYADGEYRLGEVDKHTYPIWWLDSLKLSGDMVQDLEAGRIISLRSIVTGRGGPDIDEVFNLYYIHWWSLTHFLVHFQDGRYRDAYMKVILEGGSLESFEQHIGPVEQVQEEWYAYLRQRVAELAGGTSGSR